jgi:hypothetical protein
VSDISAPEEVEGWWKFYPTPPREVADAPIAPIASITSQRRHRMGSFEARTVIGGIPIHDKGSCEGRSQNQEKVIGTIGGRHGIQRERFYEV